VLLGLVQLFLQGLCAEHHVAISLKHVRLLSGSLHDILHKATYQPSTHYFEIYDYSGCGNIPSSTALCGASTPGSEPRQPGQQGRRLIMGDGRTIRPLGIACNINVIINAYQSISLLYMLTIVIIIT
jgi:hypothetical protein